MRTALFVSRLALAIVPTTLVLLAVELSLGLAGAGKSRQPVERGFDPRASYMAAHPEKPGWLRTQMFQGEEPEIDIPPRDGRVRVLLFGGSNTARFPGSVLQRVLNERFGAGGRGYEVINLGRSGYGSARVSILFEQALELLQPDLALVYVGHNEFVEKGFSMQIERQWSAWERPLVTAAARLRSFHALVSLFEIEPGRRPDVTPERSNFEHGKFEDYTYDQTLERMERYRGNLRLMCGVASEHGVRLALGTLFSNDLTPPFVSGFPADLAPEARRAFMREFLPAAACLPAPFAILQPRTVPRFPMAQDWHQGSGCGDEPEPELRMLLGPFARTQPWWDSRANATDLLCSWLGAMQAFHRRELSGEERESLAKGAEHLHRALQYSPDHPLAHFQLGLYLYLLGTDDAAALRELGLAARDDRAPLKASGLTNEIARAVAGEFPEVKLVDLDGIVRSRTPGGLIGWEIMEDHCHAYQGIYALLMVDLAEALGPFWSAGR